MNEIIQQQFRFVYYLIALCVTAIGFSVYQTKGEPMNITHLFLGIAVLCWGISIVSGFNFLKSNITAMRLNFAITSYLNEEIDNDYQTKKKKEELKNRIKAGSSSFASQELYFYLGIIGFLSWHIINMLLVGDI